jgi:hypothetical protein
MKDLGSGEGAPDELEGKDQSNKACNENKCGAGLGSISICPWHGLSWPLYIGGQVSRIRSGSIQITVYVYDINSYFDYVYD